MRLYKKHRVAVAGCELQLVESSCEPILTFHNNLIAGHLGYKKVLQKFTKWYYWLGIAKDVNQYTVYKYVTNVK